MRCRSVALLSLVCALAASLSAAPARATDAPYTIDVILSLTGGGAFLGAEEKTSIELVEKTVNADGGIAGRPVHFLIHDDRSSPQVAVEIAKGVLPQHPAALLGSSLAAACKALAPLVAQGPVLYCFSPVIQPKPGSFVFSTDTSVKALTVASIHYFRRRGWYRLAIMTSTDASGRAGEQALHAAVALPQNKAMQIVADEHFATTDVSVEAQLARIKAAHPQLLFVWSTGSPLATVLRGLAQANLTLPVATTNGNMNWAEMKQFAPFLPKQIYFQSSPWAQDDGRLERPAAVIAKQREFYQAYAAAGLVPDQGSLVGWEPPMIVVSALRALGSGATAQQLRAYLQHLKGFAGVAGLYDFERTPQRGLDVSNAVVTRWDAAANRWQPVSRLGGAPLD